jgi:PaaA2-like antitoxin
LRARALSIMPRFMNKQSPIVSEFETAEQEASYLEWLKRKVAASLADPRPPVPHDEAMRRARAVIDKAKSKKAC